MERNGEFSFLIALDCKGDANDLFLQIGSVALKTKPDKSLDITLTDTELGAALVSTCPPFYKS